MNTRRSLPRLLACSFAAVTLLATSTFASISNEELAALLAKAEGGSGIAQYNLGLVFANQQEPVANIVEAYTWLNLAADNGATGNAAMMVISQMTPEQISQGKELLEQRRADLAAHRPIRLARASTQPIASASPISPVVGASTETDSSEVQAALKKSSDELAAAWKETEQLKAQLAKASQDAALLDQLKKERDELTATVEASTNEISAMRAAAANFEGERNALQQKIAAATQQNTDSAAAELAAAKTRLQNVESELAKATAASADLGQTRETLASLNDQLQKLTAENQRLNSLVNRAETAAQEKNAATEKALADINSTLMTARAELAEASAKAADASTTSAERDALRQQNAELAAQLQKVSAEKDQAAAQTSQAASTAQQQVNDLSIKLNAANEALSAGSTERNELTQQIASLKAAANQTSTDAQTQIAQLTAQLESDQRSASEQRETLSVRVKNAENALARATAERTELQQKLADAKPSRKEKAAQGKIEELTAELEAARASAKTNEVTGAEIAAAKDEIASLQTQLKASEEALAAAQAVPPAPDATTPAESQPDSQKELAELQMKLDTSLRSYQLKQNEVDRLEKALSSIDQERAQLADQLQNASVEVSTASAKAATNSDAAAQLAGIREQLRQTQNQLASVAYENSELKHRIAFLAPGATGLTPLNVPVSSPSLGTPNRPGTAAPSPTPTASTAEARIHTVASGDSLSTIAKNYYGSASRWPEILEANRDTIRNPSALKIGTKLKIP